MAKHYYVLNSEHGFVLVHSAQVVETTALIDEATRYYNHGLAEAKVAGLKAQAPSFNVWVAEPSFMKRLPANATTLWKKIAKAELWTKATSESLAYLLSCHYPSVKDDNMIGRPWFAEWCQRHHLNQRYVRAAIVEVVKGL